MSTGFLLLIIAVLAIIGFVLGRSRALHSVGGFQRNLHSLSHYYGSSVLLATFVPAAILVLIWGLAQPMIVNVSVTASITEEDASRISGVAEEGAQQEARIGLFMSNVRLLANGIDAAVAKGSLTEEQARSGRSEFLDIRDRVAEAGVALGSDVTPQMLKYARAYRTMDERGVLMRAVFGLGLAFALFGYTMSRIRPEFRARNVVERWITGFLIFASTTAIMTTVGIIASVIFPTISFMSDYSPLDFFFGLKWAPTPDETRTSLGLLPLIWGTLYISLVALLVAVPLGLFSAIYLSEYASPAVRGIVKPALEVLAGIPTIVYGFFALATVGPLLISLVGEGIMPSERSIMTAGLVMGMMLVPFVSSLSDDVINAVPQALRDGSYGLGATSAETITKVVLPAALPGIVGAIVLAASRAIGETMIVVLGAGALSNVEGLEANPFGAVVTITTRIVAALGGETSSFESVNVRVVFALAFTLFFVTLALNYLALHIVRKYREQYD